MRFEEFNRVGKERAGEELRKCCGAERWVEEMLRVFPFSSEEELFKTALEAWYLRCGESDWREAFTHHPKIGDLESLEKRFASTKEWVGGEQAGVAGASRATLERLAEANQAYEEKFGYIFIVCASGKSAEEMLRLAEIRLGHDPEAELRLAMAEQHKITLIRLKKLLPETDPKWTSGSQLTTHVLDTSVGFPGRGILIRLLQPGDEGWQPMAVGITDADGRIGDLLPTGRLLEPGLYNISFDTGTYFNDQGKRAFIRK